MEKEFTKLFDSNNQPIYVGDKLCSEYGYEVIVYKHSNGEYVGKLVCEPGHSCENIPYSLGGVYTKIS